jgi:hypothetical protein
MIGWKHSGSSPASHPVRFANPFFRLTSLSGFLALLLVLLLPNMLLAQTDTGLRSPTANTAETSSAGDNNGYQTSPANAHADDALNAVDTNSGTNTNLSCTDAGKDKHRFYNYGFAIPGGVVINGIEVRLDARADSTSGSPKICVQLSWNGGTSWTAAKSTARLGTALATFTLGSATDTWGRAWAVSDFTNANFRVRVINVASSTSRDFTLDWVAVRIHFGTPTPPTITSAPVTTAEVGQPYSYQAIATGTAPITWSLVSPPSGMTIGSTTGLVTWTPNTAGSFPVQIRATNLVGSADQTYTVTATVPPPQITSISPEFGPVGTLVTINGANFGATQGSSTLTFWAPTYALKTAVPISWSDTRIVAPVPVGAMSGQVIVSVGGRSNNEYNDNKAIFRSVGEIYHLHAEPSSTAGRMQLKRADPDPVSTNVSLDMTNKTDHYVDFDTPLGDPNRSGHLTQFGDNLFVTVWMRKSANVGVIYPYVELYLNDVSSGVRICASDPTPPVAYSASTPQRFQINCPPAANIEISQNDRIVMRVGVFSDQPTTGPVSVHLYLGGEINGNYDSFVVLPLPPLGVYSLSPNAGSPGDPVTISGVNFGSDEININGGRSVVEFGGVQATPTSWSDMRITVPVPNGAVTGSVTVYVAESGIRYRNWDTFTVLVKGTVTGTVTDSSTHLPLPGVDVTIQSAVEAVTAVTDTNGVYSAMVTPGSMTATFSKPGYFIQSVNDTVTAGQTLTLNRILTPLPPPPMITISSPQDGATVNDTPITVTGSVSNSAEVTVHGAAASVSGDSYSASIPLEEGSNTITATATDAYGRAAIATVTVTLPARGTLTGTVTDSSTNLPLTGVDVTIQNIIGTITTATDANGVYRAVVPEGNITVTFSKPGYLFESVAGTVTGGQTLTLDRSVAPAPPLTLTISSPQDGAVVNGAPITVTGSVSNNAGVTVNGVGASVSGNAYSASIPLNEGLNTIAVVALDGFGQSETVRVSVTLLSPGTLTVAVTSATTGLPIQSALVSVTDSAGILQTALTDANGEYTIANITPGSLTGTITKEGYVSYVLSEVISARETLILDVGLSLDDPVISLLTVTDITASTATIRWTTDQLTNGQVDYGPTSAYGSLSLSQTMTTDHRVVLTGLTPDTLYHFRVTSTNSAGASVSLADMTFTTLRPMALTITSPLEGEVIGKGEILVRGRIINGAGQEMGVTVNGVLGNIFGDEFVVNHVPLTDGVNTLTATATDSLGNTATASVNVQSSPPSDHITFSAHIESGIAPLQTTLKIDSTFPFTASTLSISGPDSAEITAISASEYQANFTVEGIYFITARVTDGQGVLHTDTVAITVLNATQMDTLLQGKWNGMKTALEAENIEAAMPYFVSRSQEKYRAIFQDLQPSLSQIFASIESLHLLSVGNDEAEVEALRTEGGIVYSYPVIFMRDETGMWKLWGF